MPTACCCTIFSVSVCGVLGVSWSVDRKFAAGPSFSEWKTAGASKRAGVVEKVREARFARGRCDATRRERLDRSYMRYQPQSMIPQAHQNVQRLVCGSAAAQPAVTWPWRAMCRGGADAPSPEFQRRQAKITLLPTSASSASLQLPLAHHCNVQLLRLMRCCGRVGCALGRCHRPVAILRLQLLGRGVRARVPWPSAIGRVWLCKSHLSDANSNNFQTLQRLTRIQTISLTSTHLY
jgi:hypothetical protein